MPDAFVIETHAKINLFLHVKSKRADGYHELETVMHEISLGDEMTATPSSSFSLSCDHPAVPTDEKNLVLKAARHLQRRHAQTPAFHFNLKKRIPAGSGLGGGSSNGVAALLFLASRLKSQGETISESTLDAIAADLGSDTNFFLAGGTAFCTGRGEKVAPLKRRRLFFNLILPPFSCLTPAVFSQGRPEDWRADTEKFLAGWQSQHLPMPQNDLQSACNRAYPQMAELWRHLQATKISIQLSGSGSTLYSVHDTSENRDAAGLQLKKHLPPPANLVAAESHLRS